MWSFRVERFDEVGNRVALVPVELRGLKVEGSLSDGDRVRMTGRLRGGTLRPKLVENLTTGATVRARDLPMPAIVAVITVMLLIVGFIGWVAFNLITGDDGPPDEFPFPAGLVPWLSKT